MNKTRIFDKRYYNLLITNFSIVVFDKISKFSQIITMLTTQKIYTKHSATNLGPNYAYSV